jgi:hypothetical protein
MYSALNLYDLLKKFLISIQKDNEGFSSVITPAELSVGAHRSPNNDSAIGTLKRL